MSSDKKEVAYRVTGIRLYTIDHLNEPDLSPDTDGLRQATDVWIQRANESPNGFGVGSMEFKVEREDGGPGGVITLSTTDKELFISVPS